jgi:hypothetical protein
MATTVDHLRADHRVIVLQTFTDLSGKSMRKGESGVIRELAFDPIRMEITLRMERAEGNCLFVFPVQANSGPRNGHMREYFELVEDVSASEMQNSTDLAIPEEPKMSRSDSSVCAIENSAETWWHAAYNTFGPDRLRETEEAMLRATDNIGPAASIAEMYAQRMRAFQNAKDEPRAIIAFQLALEWMNFYASQATSGGEGAALSYESELFRSALVKEFGYDPTQRDKSV